MKGREADLDAGRQRLPRTARRRLLNVDYVSHYHPFAGIKGDKSASEEAFANGARLKREKDAELTNNLEQGMRGGVFPKPLEVAK